MLILDSRMLKYWHFVKIKAFKHWKSINLQIQIDYLLMFCVNIGKIKNAKKA